MTPALVEVTFDANAFNAALKDTLVDHAGVKNITLNTTNDKVVASINLEKLTVFDVALNNDKEFAITFNYGDSAEVVEKSSQSGKEYINGN